MELEGLSSVVWHLNFLRDILSAEVLLRRNGSQLHTGIPSPENKYQEEEFPWHLTVKTSGNYVSDRQGLWEA